MSEDCWEVYLAALALCLNAGPASYHGGGKSAARSEFSAHAARDRLYRCHNIPQHAVHRVFVKYAQAPISKQIHLQSFELQTLLARLIFDRDRSIVRQAGFRTNRRVLRETDGDLVTRKMVWPGF